MKRTVIPRLHDTGMNFRTGMKISLRHKNRGELAPVWLAPAWHFVLVSCKRIQSHKREPEWTRAGMKVVQSLNSPFFPPHIGAEPGRAKEESRITCMRMPRTNQSKIIRSQPRRSRQCVAQCLFFSSRSERKHFLWRWYCGKKHKNVKYRGLYSYRQRVRVITLSSNIFSYCFCMLSDFAKVFERKVWRVQVAHLHNAARALSSPSRCFQLTTNLGKISFVIFDIVIKKQIECGLPWHWWNSTDLGLIGMFLLRVSMG